MPLNMENIFGKADDDLKDRWQQSGSSVKNIAVNIFSTATQYTVTTGKKLYITQMVVVDDGSDSGDGFDIKDGSSGSVKISYICAAAATINTINFNTPLEFNTSIYSVESGSIAQDVYFYGWEESK